MKRPLLLSSLFFLLILTTLFQPPARSQDPAPSARQPVATIAGRTIYEDDLLPLTEEPLQQLRNQEYEVKSRALEKMIDEKLLETTAARKSLTPDQLIAQEVMSKISEPTDSEIQAFYLGQHERRPLDEIKSKLREALKQARLDLERTAYMERLRRESQVSVLLTPHKIEIGFDSARLRGSPNAPITIVEFSDFECPFCRHSEQIINAVLSKYGDKVKLGYRDFPLRQAHPHSEAAAEASRCASEQGKFWEYHDLLFSGSGKLDAAGLLDAAHAAQLNDAQFLSCLHTEKFKGAVDADVKAGARAGVTGTPAFFINGIFISGAQPAAVFEKTIDAELVRVSAVPNRVY